MMMETVFRIFLLLFVQNFVDASQIPPAFKICRREDPKLNKCLQRNLQSLIPTFPYGYPELKIDSLDPLFDKEIRFNLQINQLQTKFIYLNVTIRGFSESRVHDVRADLQDDSFYMEIDITTKKLLLNAAYKADGNFLGFKFGNNGFVNTTIDDSVYTWKITGSIVAKNNKKYVKVTKFFMRPEIGNIKNYLTDIVPGNPELSKLFLDFVNNNWRMIYRELIFVVEATWGRIGKKFSNKIFSKIPYDDLFPVDLD